jgi:hypothetical protein
MPSGPESRTAKIVGLPYGMIVRTARYYPASGRGWQGDIIALNEARSQMKYQPTAKASANPRTKVMMTLGLTGSV